jgi:hypothetical protein
MVCNRCGAELEDDTKCTVCGWEINTEESNRSDSRQKRIDLEKALEKHLNLSIISNVIAIVFSLCLFFFLITISGVGVDLEKETQSDKGGYISYFPEGATIVLDKDSLFGGLAGENEETESDQEQSVRETIVIDANSLFKDNITEVKPETDDRTSQNGLLILAFIFSIAAFVFSVFMIVLAYRVMKKKPNALDLYYKFSTMFIINKEMTGIYHIYYGLEDDWGR